MRDEPVLSAVEAALVEHFGHRPARASVSFVGVEPIEILRFEPIPGERAYLSLGMSRHPMTGADESFLSAEGPCAELMLHVRDPTDELAEIWRRLAVLAAAPAVEGVVYRAGMTVDVGEPLVAGASCTGGVLTNSALPAVATPAGEVTLLLVVPATPNELAWARVRGSDALSARLHGANVDLLDVTRRSVDLG
ncbi:MAG: suppressor of fused domain protein [Jatrophihabitans sp.]